MSALVDGIPFGSLSIRDTEVWWSARSNDCGVGDPPYSGNDMFFSRFGPQDKDAQAENASDAMLYALKVFVEMSMGEFAVSPEIAFQCIGRYREFSDCFEGSSYVGAHYSHFMAPCVWDRKRKNEQAAKRGRGKPGAGR